ncbi:MAG: hypothetical protein AAB521_04980 [Patescibacteria group bacterium]
MLKIIGKFLNEVLFSVFLILDIKGKAAYKRIRLDIQKNKDQLLTVRSIILDITIN